MNYYLMAFRKYAEFSGRSRRSEYWYFFLFNMLISWALQFLAMYLAEVGVILSAGYSLAALIPGLAVAVRRLHDVGKSGWFILIALIPIIGAIWLIVLLATDGDKGSNEYGQDPKNPGAVDVDSFGEKEEEEA